MTEETRICDFCATAPAPHVYAADDIVVDDNTVLGVSASAGGWAACGTCAAMIDTTDRKALLARSAKMLYRKHPSLGYLVILNSVARSHHAFWKARK